MPRKIRWIAWGLIFGLAVVAGRTEATEPPADSGILVVPVEFADVRMDRNRYASAVGERMDALREYFTEVSLGAEDMQQKTRWHMAPVVRLAHPRVHYGRDRIRVHLRNGFRVEFSRDVGDFDEAYAGQTALRKEALSCLISQGYPVARYRYIIYVVPGKGGNFPGSEQPWPVSMSGDPRKIGWDEAKGEPTGPWRTGILIALENPAGVYIHEFGHQIGLPDLYPDLGRLTVDGGYPSMMAYGDDNHVAMLALVRAQVCRGDRGKGDWLGRRLRHVTRAGTHDLDARTSGGSTLALVIPAPSAAEPGGAYVVECFDRAGLDRDLPVCAPVDLAVREGWDARRPPMGVLIYRVDSTDLSAVRRLEMQSPVPVLRKLVPDRFSAHLPGLSHVFFAGDEIVTSEGVRIRVRSLDGGTAGVEVDFVVPDEPAVHRIEARIDRWKRQLYERLEGVLQD